MNDIVIECKNLYKSYRDSSNDVEVLSDINFAIHAGERIAIVGPSGSGKSTLLHLLGGLDKPTQGEVYLKQHNWQIIPERKRCRLRNQCLGFVYQFHHLLPEFSALENTAIPLLLAGKSIEEAEIEAKNILDQVGLSHRWSHKPAQLSGGERQRVAIARALVQKPYCVFADEPTGNLDQATASKVFQLMLELNQKYNTALVIVTHDEKLAKSMDRIYILQNKGLTRLE